jgi:hypothetical protein
MTALAFLFTGSQASSAWARDLIGKDHLIRVTLKQAAASDKPLVKFELCRKATGIPANELKGCEPLGTREFYRFEDLEELRGSEKLKSVATGVGEIAGIALLASFGTVLASASAEAVAFSGSALATLVVPALNATSYLTATGPVWLPPIVAALEGDLNPYRRWTRANTLLGEKVLRDVDDTTDQDVVALARRLDQKLARSAR